MLTLNICDWIVINKCNEWKGKPFKYLSANSWYTHCHTYKYEMYCRLYNRLISIHMHVWLRIWKIVFLYYGKYIVPWCCCSFQANVDVMSILFVGNRNYVAERHSAQHCLLGVTSPGVLLKWEFTFNSCLHIKRHHVLSKMFSEHSISCSNKMFQLFWYLSMSWNRKRKF